MTSTPLPRIPQEDLPEQFKALGDVMFGLVGDATAIQVIAHSEPCADWYFNDFYGQLFHNGRPGMKVSVRDKRLLRLRLSKQHGCALCNRGNEAEAAESGFSAAQIDSLIMLEPDSTLFSEAELAVIGLADEMALGNQDGRLTPEKYARMRAHYSDEQIVELATVACVLAGMSKMMFVLDLVPREATCSIAASGSTSSNNRLELATATA